MKTFNFICQELSLLAGEPLVGKRRFDLWAGMASWGYLPYQQEDPVRAATCLERAESYSIRELREKIPYREWNRFLERLCKFNPNVETPEEIFTRIAEG